MSCLGPIRGFRAIIGTPPSASPDTREKLSFLGGLAPRTGYGLGENWMLSRRGLPARAQSSTASVFSRQRSYAPKSLENVTSAKMGPKLRLQPGDFGSPIGLPERLGGRR